MKIILFLIIEESDSIPFKMLIKSSEIMFIATLSKNLKIFKIALGKEQEKVKSKRIH
jgi:hypothetical protein